MPAEIRDLVIKSDAELLVHQLLERKDRPVLSTDASEFPGEDDGQEIRLPRGKNGRRT